MMMDRLKKMNAKPEVKITIMDKVYAGLGLIVLGMLTYDMILGYADLIKNGF